MGILTLKPEAFLEENLKCLYFTQDLHVQIYRTLCPCKDPLLSVQKCSLDFLRTENFYTLTSGALRGESSLSFEGLRVYILLVLLEYVLQLGPCR